MATEFPLLKLIPELRLEIYEHVFAGAHPQPRTFRFRSTPAPPLLLTCKQVYAEAIDIYYRSLTILVPIWAASLGCIANIVPRERLGKVRELKVDVTDVCEAGTLPLLRRNEHALAREQIVRAFERTNEGKDLLVKMKLVCRMPGCKLPQGTC